MRPVNGLILDRWIPPRIVENNVRGSGEVQTTTTATLNTLVADVITGNNSFELPPPIYPVNGQPVWGLTAKIITELLEVVGVAASSQKTP